MHARTALITSLALTASLVSGAAQAALQGRDLNSSAGSFEAYYDTVLDITWLADANYGAGSSYDDFGLYSGSTSTTDGRMTWANANAWAANISFTDGVNVYDNWRLPTVEPVNGTSFNYFENITSYQYYDGSYDHGYNITSPNSEMAYMFYVNLSNSGYRTPGGSLSGCFDVNGGYTCLNNVGPFSNLQSWVYFSGTEYGGDTSGAWHFYMALGEQGTSPKISDGYAWAVSPGDVAAVPEPQTYALMLAGLGLIGWRARRRG